MPSASSAVRLLACALPLAVALAALPAASADGPVSTLECRTTYVGVGAIILAEVDTGECGVAVVPYTCDVEWYGGHGLLGGFIFTCTPGLDVPCVWPVCRP
jgi:hypothetical protein